MFLGSTGAGPIYSLEMAKALSATERCQLQIIISRRISNIEVWKKEFHGNNTELIVVDTYNHNKFSFAINTIFPFRALSIVKAINNFRPEILYTPFLLTWDFLIYPKLFKHIRIISTLHDPHPHDSTKNIFAKWVLRQNDKAYHYVNDVIVLNHRDVEYVKRNFCSNVHVIPHASFSYYKISETVIHRKTLNNTIGFLGRIEPYKGLDLLVDAFLELNNETNLLIAGSGKIGEELYNKIVSSPRIELINRYIDDNEFEGLLRRMDFVVLPYKRASQSGVIPLAFALGKTVIATNVGALSEQVPEGTGIIVEPSTSAIKEAIEWLYSHPDKVFEYDENALKYANNELTWEHSAELLLRIFDN